MPSTDPNVVFASAPPTAVPAELTSSFNPGGFDKNSPDILVYFNDGSAKPGKTYKYRVEYQLLNPLFNKAVQHVNKGNLAWISQLALDAGQSEYSPEITLPQKTFFYCDKASGPQNLQAGYPFDVFTWADGLWRKQTFSAVPGDLIGAVVNNYDFSTGYTYVDGARRHEKFFVTVVDDSGQAQVLDAAKETSSEDHKTKNQWIDQENAAGTPNANGSAGADTGGGATPTPAGPPGGGP